MMRIQYASQGELQKKIRFLIFFIFVRYTNGELFQTTHKTTNPFMAIIGCMEVDNGSFKWKRQFGSSVYDRGNAVSIDGDYLVVGGTTSGFTFSNKI